MASLFLKLVNMSLSAGWLVLAVLAVRLLFKRAPKWLHCLLWGLVAVRLVCPVTVESVLSLIPSAEPIPPTFITSPSPEVDTGLPELDAMLNPGLAGSLTTPPENSVNTSQVLAFAATVLWVVGMVCMAVYALVSTLRLRYRVRESMPLEAGVRVCDGIPSPFILGVFRPRIYLPPGLSGEQTAYVLAHERAHLKRCDHLWKPLGWLLLTVYWFNPLLWVAYVFLCRDIEQACDEKVVRDMAVEGRKAYSAALLACSAPRRLISACPLAFGESGVKQRIKSVLHYKKPAFWLIVAAAVACVAVAVCFLTNPPSAKVEESLDMLIVDTVKAQYAATYDEADCPAVAYTVFGTDKVGDRVTVYGMVLYQEYSITESGDLQVIKAGHNAFALTVEKKDAAYTLVEYWVPKDGNEYEPSIREKFPWRYERRAMDTQRYIDRHQAACLEIARGFFGIAAREDYTTYVCDVNGTTFSLEKAGDRCTFAASGLASYQCAGTYRMDNSGATLVFDNMTLVFTREGAGLVFDAKRSDEIPKELHFGVDYHLPDGTLFTPRVDWLLVSTAEVTCTGLLVGDDGIAEEVGWQSDSYAPVWCMNSRAELDAFIEKRRDTLKLDLSLPHETASFVENMAAYNEAFFRDKALLVVYLEAYAGTVQHQLATVGYSQQHKSMRLTYYRYAPIDATGERSYWLATVTVDKNTAQNMQTFEAELSPIMEIDPNSTTPGGNIGFVTRTTVVDAMKSFTGRVLEVSKASGDLLLSCTDGTFADKVEVRLDSYAGCLPAVGDELVVYYSGQAIETYPPAVYARSISITVSAADPAYCVVGFYDTPVGEDEVHKAVAKNRSTLTEKDYTRLQTMLDAKVWVLDAIIDRTKLYFDGYLAFGDGRQYYFDLKGFTLYDAKTQQLATITNEDKEFLVKYNQGTITSGNTTTGTKPSAKTTTTTTTTAKKEGFEVQFLRVERLNPSVMVGGKDIWELFAPLNGHGVLTQIGDKIIYRIVNYEKDSGRYVGTGDSMNCTVEISGDIATVTVATDGNHAGPFVSADFWVYDQNGTRVGVPNFGPQNPSVQFINTRSSVVKNGVVDTGVVAMMLRHYGDAHMHCPYGELTGSGVAEKVIPVTVGTEWIDTAVKTLKSYSLNGYEYYKLSLKDDTLTLRFAKEM